MIRHTLSVNLSPSSTCQHAILTPWLLLLRCLFTPHTRFLAVVFISVYSSIISARPQVAFFRAIMASKSKDKPLAKLPTRPRSEKKKTAASGAKKPKGSASSRGTPSTRGSTSKSSSGASSPAPQPVNGVGLDNGGTSTPCSETSQAVKDFYAHLEASSSESSRWDTDSVLGAVLEDLTDDAGTPGGELISSSLSVRCTLVLHPHVYQEELVFPFFFFSLSRDQPAFCTHRLVLPSVDLDRGHLECNIGDRAFKPVEKRPSLETMKSA